MQPSGDFTSYYPYPYPPPPPPPPAAAAAPISNPNPAHSPNPSPNPISNPSEFQPSNPPVHSTFASAPPYSHYPAADYPSSAAPNLPPSAPSYSQPQSQSQFSTYQSYNPSSLIPDQSLTYPHLQPPAYYQQDSPSLAGSYAPPPNPNPSANPVPNTNQNPFFPSPYPSFENPYESSTRYDPGMTDFYEKKPENGFPNNWGGDDSFLNEGAYRYDGGRTEPYGARGTGGSARSSSVAFDDYGRSLSFGSSSRDGGSGAKIVRAVPKADAQQDVKSGVQKFRVKLLAEGAGSNIDVLCQIGLDGIRMLDPGNYRTLRIYPLETVTRWEVLDSSIFAFWAKSSVDIEPRRIRLKSNSYTTSTILDTVTAASVQLKEMGGRLVPSRSGGATDAGKQSDQQTEKKKGLMDWMNMIKPPNEEKDHWVPDEAVTKCASCGADFNAFVRKHHCRNCGDIFCDKCTHGRIALTADETAQPVRVCDRCMAEVTQRLNNAKEAASRPGLQSHEDLAKKLQEEMERNRKSSAGSKSDGGSTKRMREVACPICTVHLQVQVPATGSETIECGVCQHPFLVSSH
ncbi:protein FREE1 [Dioscorea cayenensis subsp. rotundata]|uniref:Protein FREE1 n=1 Tax=Dioscorea cayennensis subsp. rotundata TaxID=55577 RepID=A0AB40B9I6_DIOCR|nr:protein FREE1 [Dioscorea cayenensis subsp. rotundata]